MKLIFNLKILCVMYSMSNTFEIRVLLNKKNLVYIVICDSAQSSKLEYILADSLLYRGLQELIRM